MESTTKPENLVHLRYVAARLGLSVRAIYRLVARGDLPKPVKVGGATRFFESDVENYFKTLQSQRR